MPARASASSAPPPLPARPWLDIGVPLLWRADDVLQIGDDSRALIIGAGTHEAGWLRTLKGDRTLAEAMASAAGAGIDARRATSLLSLLVDAGALDDAASMPASLRHAPPDLRDRLMADLRVCRRVHRHPRLANAAFERRLQGTVVVHGHGKVADAVCAALSQAGVGSVLAGHSISFARRERMRSPGISCHVLCAGTPVIDDLGACALDVPHVAVRVHDERAAIGPFVIPGLTGCLRCEDLHRRDADPAWPRLAIQWAHRNATVSAVDSGLALLAAGWAASITIAWIEATVDGDRGWPAAWLEDAPPMVNGCLTVDIPGLMPRIESREPHPLCGCGWGQDS